MDITLAGVLLAVVLPLLVGVVTKASTSSAEKSILLAGLSALAVVVQQFIDAGGLNGFDLKTGLTQFVVLWVTAVASYYGFTKPTGIAAAVNANVGRKDKSA